MMGDFGRFHKCRPEQGSVRIPMVVDASCCGASQGTVSAAPVELEDLATTFMDFAGITPDPKWQARSMRPILDGTCERVRSYATSEYIYTVNRDTHKPYVGSWHMVTDGKYKLVEFDNEIISLYDLEADPRELDNLAESMPKKAYELRHVFIDEIPKFRHVLAEADRKALEKAE